MPDWLRKGTLKSLMAVMAVGALLHAQAAAACEMPDPEPSAPCCIEHCAEAIAESTDCAEPVAYAIAVEIRGADVRIADDRGPATDQGPTAGAPPAAWIALQSQRSSPERFSPSHLDTGADTAVYLLTRRIRI